MAANGSEAKHSRTCFSTPINTNKDYSLLTIEDTKHTKEKAKNAKAPTPQTQQEAP